MSEPPETIRDWFNLITNWKPRKGDGRYTIAPIWRRTFGVLMLTTWQRADGTWILRIYHERKRPRHGGPTIVTEANSPEEAYVAAVLELSDDAAG